MISRKNVIKLIAVITIAIIGAVYWYFAEQRTGPLEQMEQTIDDQR
jgi:hypothetical protein